MITPKVGQPARYHPGPDDPPFKDGAPVRTGEPHDAAILAVNANGRVQLAVNDGTGNGYRRADVVFWSGEGATPDAPYAEGKV